MRVQDTVRVPAPRGMRLQLDAARHGFFEPPKDVRQHIPIPRRQLTPVGQPGRLAPRQGQFRVAIHLLTICGGR